MPTITVTPQRCAWWYNAANNLFFDYHVAGSTRRQTNEIHLDFKSSRH